MNALRRKELNEISGFLSDIWDRLVSVKDEEEEYLYNIPENLQASERYEKAEYAVANLETAIDHLEEALGSIEEAIE